MSLSEDKVECPCGDGNCKDYHYPEEKVREAVKELKAGLLEKSFIIVEDGLIIDTDKRIRKAMIDKVDEIFGEELV